MDLNPLHCSRRSLLGALSVACPGSISPWRMEQGCELCPWDSCCPRAPGLALGLHVSVKGTHRFAQEALALCLCPALAPMGILSVPLGTPEWLHLHQEAEASCWDVGGIYS